MREWSGAKNKTALDIWSLSELVTTTTSLLCDQRTEKQYQDEYLFLQIYTLNVKSICIEPLELLNIVFDTYYRTKDALFERDIQGERKLEK